jgi:hypothetical protein
MSMSSVPRSSLLQGEIQHTSPLIYHIYTPSPSFNANAPRLLAPEQELCFSAQHTPGPTAWNLDRVFSTGGNYPTRLHTLPTPKE